VPPGDDITEEQVIQSVRIFSREAGAGPSGTRPDFLRQLIDRNASSDIAKTTAAFRTMLANGEAPQALVPFSGGACGYAFSKEAKSADGAAASTATDARPVCCGEAWRRVVGNAVLTIEGPTLQKYLLPHQLAVKVRAGVETLPHLARQWAEESGAALDRVLANFDESNAHNTVDRAAFLRRAHEVIPGAARWLRWVYPLATPTFVFYNGDVIHSSAGGQQGCPLIAACHALVQRALPECLCLVEVAAGTTPLMPPLQPPADVDIALPMMVSLRAAVSQVGHHTRTAAQPEH
jgi:hypothetical protein